MSFLVVNNLDKHYGNNTVLQNISFSLKKGEIVAILGPNGSGKTTIVKSIAGLIRSSGGSIHYQGRLVSHNPDYLKNIGAVLEGSRNIHWRLTVKQNAFYFAALHLASKKTVEKNVYELMDLLGLSKLCDMEAGKLSTGNRQKVAVLCAMAHQPQLVLMDEPTLGLDVDTVTILQRFILDKAKDTNCTFLITSHDLNFIDRICDKVLVLMEGKIVFDGKAQTLKEQLRQYQALFQFAGNIPEAFEKLIRSYDRDHVFIERKDNHTIIARFNLPETGLALASFARNINAPILYYENTEVSMELAYREILRDFK